MMSLKRFAITIWVLCAIGGAFAYSTLYILGQQIKASDYANRVEQEYTQLGAQNVLDSTLRAPESNISGVIDAAELQPTENNMENVDPVVQPVIQETVPAPVIEPGVAPAIQPRPPRVQYEAFTDTTSSRNTTPTIVEFNTSNQH